MKNTTVPSFLSPTILLLVILALAIVALTVAGTTLPLLSNLKVNLVLLLVLGMAICALGGIGRVAARHQWRHPLSIAGYVLGGLILLLALAVLAGWTRPYIQDDDQAFLLIALLIGAKVLVSGVHVFWDRLAQGGK